MADDKKPTTEEQLAVLEKRVKELVTENSNLKAIIVDKDNTIKEMRITSLTAELDAVRPVEKIEPTEKIEFNFEY